MIVDPNACFTLEEAQDLVAEHAPNSYYTEHYRQMEDDYLPHLCALLDRHVPGRALEFGPGWGTMALWLASRGWDVTVVDSVDVGHFMTQELLDFSGVQYVRENIEEPSAGLLGLGTYSLVVMTQVIPHLRWRPTCAIRNCRALMADGGLFVTTALDCVCYPGLQPPHGTDWRSIPEWEEGIERPNFTEAMEMCMYSAATLKGLLGQAFGKVNVWRAEGSTCLFGVCRH